MKGRDDDLPVEELEYSMDDDHFVAPVNNRFTGDWVALHMMATVCRLTDQRAAAYSFLKNGGMTFAKVLGGLTADKLAQAARVTKDTGGTLEQMLNNTGVPREVKDAMQAMHAASSAVLGTDGHRRYCRHEGVAYMEAFGPPLVFLTPNVADTQHPLLLVVQGESVDLGKVSADMATSLPKYRDMLRRLAQDPVGQVLQFELLMRLFFQHVLNVRPETLDCRRSTARTVAREWCSDGAATNSTGAGMIGPVLAFRGEIESQGRGSLHPHVLVWLVCGHLDVLSSLSKMLQGNKVELQLRLKQFMHMAVASFESLSQASVQAAPRCLGDMHLSEPVKITEVARNLSKYDGGTDVDLLREMPELTEEQREYLSQVADDDWRRPTMQVGVTSETQKVSFFSLPINELPVAETPSYRLRPLLCDREVPELDAQAWQAAFQKDLHSLMPALLRHVCTDSCFKYSDQTSAKFKICRHGFYHVVHVMDGCRVRRKGKALRPCLHAGTEAEAEYGMQGRLRPIQLTPFECQTCYGGTVAGRHNLDLQDMRRLVDPSLWMDESDHFPHTGSVDQLGYMAWYEWTGSAYDVRKEAPTEPISWLSRRSVAPAFRAGWVDIYRNMFDTAAEKPSTPEPQEQQEPSVAKPATQEPEEQHDPSVATAIGLSINEAFCDGINTGFYVNNYTTKPGPGLAALLEELQKGTPCRVEVCLVVNVCLTTSRWDELLETNYDSGFTIVVAK